MICVVLSCKRIKDWVTKTAFLAKENLAILLFTKENKNWTKDKIVLQHLHECSIKTSIQVGNQNLTPTKVTKSIFHGYVWFILDG